jgi:hypothetical protein
MLSESLPADQSRKERPQTDRSLFVATQKNDQPRILRWRGATV